MVKIEIDYLVIGAGSVGLGFTDTLLVENDTHITTINWQDKPGGHWNDDYPFVALHQPSAFYDVNTTPLGTKHKETFGSRSGTILTR